MGADTPLYLFRPVAFIWYLCVNSLRLLGSSIHVRRTRICKIDNVATIKQRSSAQRFGENVGVTISRPLRGIDDVKLYECSKSTFVQTYRNVEVVMCVSDPNDPAVTVARGLQAEFPEVKSRLLIGPDHPYGINPKVNNLVKGYKEAAFDLIWCLDSNVTMHPKALERAVPCFVRNVQSVHHLPLALAESDSNMAHSNFMATEDGWGGRLDEVYMSTAHSTFYTGINAVGIAPCVTGKSNSYSRKDLDAAVGASPGCGLEKFAKYMAEDQMISEALWAAGGRTALAPDAAVQPLGPHITLSDYWNRRSRWIRLRKYMVTSATSVEPFTDTFFNTAFIVLVCGWSSKSFLILVLSSFLSDTVNYNISLRYSTKPAMPMGQWIVFWLAREVLAFPLWLWAMSGRRIWWRDHYYKIRHDLVAEPAD